MILDLVPEDDPILRQVLPRFDFDNPPIDPSQLARDLTETMIANKGLGLSANQCGLPYRVFVMNGNPVHACFNPRIVHSSPEQVLMSEGCLSYPGLYVRIKRPAVIRLRYQQPDGDTITKEFHGVTARCVQHELDHLDGIVYLDRATRFHKEQAYKAVKDLKRLKKRTGAFA